jgi:ABC-type nitrate/sulfonate/bicarbonate transport system ATPase subunit
LEIERVSLRLGQQHILEELSLSLFQGEFVTILGPSGAGKSTLFRLLTGALRPDSGAIRVQGEELQPNDRSFALMPQRDALMPWRRVIDNVILGLEVQGLSRRAARARVQPLFPVFGLEGVERHFPGQLSGGMRQRAAFLRTIVLDRPILLLDEPFGALDALTRRQMQRWLEVRWQSERWSTLLITHDVREAVALSDRIYLLSARPARVLRDVAVPFARPRLGQAPSPNLHELEDRILADLMQLGEPT